MSWVVADPKIAAIQGTIVLMVRIPQFPDELPLEAFADKDLKDPRIRAKPVVMATEKGFEEMKLLGENATLVGPGQMVKTLTNLAMARQIVCLRWAD